MSEGKHLTQLEDENQPLNLIVDDLNLDGRILKDAPPEAWCVPR